MKSTTISKLKASLNEYLMRVKAGEEPCITERGKTIAKIVAVTRDEETVPHTSTSWRGPGSFARERRACRGASGS